MAKTNQTNNLEDIRVGVRTKLAALWATMMFLYIYADVLSLFRPGQLDEIMSGKMGPLDVSQATLFAAAVLVIIPALMVFLSLVLRPKINRWTNIILGILFTLVNISNLIGEDWAYYFLFGILEIIAAILIVRYAWRWKSE